MAYGKILINQLINTIMADAIKKFADINGEKHPVELPAHTHAMSDVVNLNIALLGKASVNHSHSVNDVTGLSTLLSGKANATHTHMMSDVDGLNSALSGKADADHTHDMSDVDGLTDALDSKVGPNHIHSQEQIEYLVPIMAQCDGTTAVVSDPHEDVVETYIVEVTGAEVSAASMVDISGTLAVTENYNDVIEQGNYALLKVFHPSNSTLTLIHVEIMNIQ